jgi:hypothetical protein
MHHISDEEKQKVEVEFRERYDFFWPLAYVAVVFWLRQTAQLG